MVKTKVISKLFDNKKFQAASIHFFSEPRSVSEVEKISGVSRTTIYNFFRIFRTRKTLLSGKNIEYYDDRYLRWIGKREKLYYFTPRILVDWLKVELDFTVDEVRGLEGILEKESIERALRKNSKTWTDVIAKLMLPLCAFDHARRYGVGEKFVFQSLPKLSVYKGFTRGELENFSYEFQEAIKTLALPISKIAGKFKRANIPVEVTLTDLSTLIEDVSKGTGEMILQFLPKTGGFRILQSIEKNIRELFTVEELTKKGSRK